MWIDNRLLIDDWNGHAPEWREGAISLVGGRKYAIKKEFLEITGEAQAKLYWQYPGQGIQLIPNGNLYPAHENTFSPPLNPCDFTDRNAVGYWNGTRVETRLYIVQNQQKWVLVTVEQNSALDRHYPRGDNFSTEGGIQWTISRPEKTCFGAGDTGWWGLSFPEGLPVPNNYRKGTSQDGAVYFELAGAARIPLFENHENFDATIPNKRFQVYPNPAARSFTIKIHLEKNKSTRLIVSDALGKVWFQKSLNGDGIHKEKVSLHGVPPGIYLVKCGSSEKLEVNKIVITQ